MALPLADQCRNIFVVEQSDLLFTSDRSSSIAVFSRENRENRNNFHIGITIA